MNMKNVNAGKTQKNTRGMVQEISEILKNIHEDQQQFDRTVAELKDNICLTRIKETKK
jgi:hypothetical protein